MEDFLSGRLATLKKRLVSSQLEAILITNLKNIYYLTGFSGTAATVLVTPKRSIFITDARYTLMAKNKVKHFDVIESRTPLKEILTILRADKCQHLAFENEISFAFYQSLQAQFSGIELQAQSGYIEEQRIIKDASEIATIAKACSISDKAFIDVLDYIKPGQTTELDVANFLDFQMRHYGASGTSFETIAASGHRSAMPHGRASNKVIDNGDSLTMDFGCYYDHYVSDMTRTIHIGQTTDQEKEIYQITLEANKALIEKARAGMTYTNFDRIPREVISNAGYGPNFTHGIGHGIGLDIHENPYFTKSDKILQAGMVVTDEPGIYLDNLYGVRIEDDLVLTEDGCQVLTLAPKELIVIN
ncbi:M24 family metallopeptidase [Streptococcus parauberis]|uniref:Putative Xaa-Pro dipeptidase n=1 Tax=Streptococcus parauberis NCFD 2020 TaxID=873447 RepID=F1YX80_9STRE|nr:Xaa-Pro peptidase family protein [Streptococcus parauberis]EGE53300.1 putative Xaa-Pro dipeptidase [Streptococcus parauberis NCFD 2020]